MITQFLVVGIQYYTGVIHCRIPTDVNIPVCKYANVIILYFIALHLWEHSDRYLREISHPTTLSNVCKRRRFVAKLKRSFTVLKENLRPFVIILINVLTIMFSLLMILHVRVVICD